MSEVINIYTGKPVTEKVLDLYETRRWLEDHGGFIAGYGAAIADLRRAGNDADAHHLLEQSGLTAHDFIQAGLDDCDLQELKEMYREVSQNFV